MNRQLENKLSSREVCEMMNLKHTNLLQKIDSINLDFRELKIEFSKYWQESTYKVEGQLREYREFQITKKGCEFLAHKTTGTKGNLFTDKYMDRFDQMKEIINKNIPVGNIEKEKSKEDTVLGIIKTLPNDNLKNMTINRLLDFIDLENGNRKQVNRLTNSIISNTDFRNSEFANGFGISGQNRIEIIKTSFGSIRKIKNKDWYVLIDITNAVGIKRTTTVKQIINNEFIRKIERDLAKKIGVRCTIQGLLLISLKGICDYASKASSDKTSKLYSEIINQM